MLPILNNQELTMSSREIAELTGKQHQHVRRSIQNMLSDLDLDASTFGHIYLDSKNREQAEYRLPKREALLLSALCFLKPSLLILELVMTNPVPLVTQKQKIIEIKPYKLKINVIICTVKQ